MSMLTRAALPARLALPILTPSPSGAAESAPDCSLHRRVSVANDAVFLPETAQSSSIITTTDAAAEDAAVGGSGDAQGAVARSAVWSMRAAARFGRRHRQEGWLSAASGHLRPPGGA